VQVARTEAQCADRAFFETPYCSRCVLSGSVGFTGALARLGLLETFEYLQSTQSMAVYS